MVHVMLEVVSSFCEIPEKKPLTYRGVETSEKGRAKEGFLLGVDTWIKSWRLSTKGNQGKRGVGEFQKARITSAEAKG